MRSIHDPRDHLSRVIVLFRDRRVRAPPVLELRVPLGHPVDGVGLGRGDRDVVSAACAREVRLVLKFVHTPNEYP